MRLPPNQQKQMHDPANVEHWLNRHLKTEIEWYYYNKSRSLPQYRAFTDSQWYNKAYGLQRDFNGLCLGQWLTAGYECKWKCACCNCDLILICNNHSVKNSCCVDHNHDTGFIRSLLCNHCNVMLGFAREHIGILAKMIAYLHEYGCNKQTGK